MVLDLINGLIEKVNKILVSSHNRHVTRHYSPIEYEAKMAQEMLIRSMMTAARIASEQRKAEIEWRKLVKKKRLHFDFFILYTVDCKRNWQKRSRKMICDEDLKYLRDIAARIHNKFTLPHSPRISKKLRRS